MIMYKQIDYMELYRQISNNDNNYKLDSISIENKALPEYVEEQYQERLKHKKEQNSINNISRKKLQISNYLNYGLLSSSIKDNKYYDAKKSIKDKNGKFLKREKDTTKHKCGKFIQIKSKLLKVPLLLECK